MTAVSFFFKLEYTWKKNENSSGVQILKTRVYVS